MPNIVMADKSQGGISIDDFLNADYDFGHVSTSNAQIPKYSFCYRSGEIFFNAPNISFIPDSLFYINSGLKEISAPEITYIGASAFQSATSLKNVVFPKCSQCFSSAFYGATNLESVDFGGIPTSTAGFNRNSIFTNCTKLKTIILRGNAIWPLSNINTFTGTPFASGGTGGTIYIPKSLYDHLGDGTSSDYKAASNWTTIDGYGTITWAQIEGSTYETHYGDGTLIPT